MSVFLEEAEGEECGGDKDCCLMKYLGLLYDNKNFTYLILSYFTTISVLPSVFLCEQKLQFLTFSTSS